MKRKYTLKCLTSVIYPYAEMIAKAPLAPIIGELWIASAAHNRVPWQVARSLCEVGSRYDVARMTMPTQR
jgi:hypothetical protein